MTSLHFNKDPILIWALLDWKKDTSVSMCEKSMICVHNLFEIRELVHELCILCDMGSSISDTLKKSHISIQLRRSLTYELTGFKLSILHCIQSYFWSTVYISFIKWKMSRCLLFQYFLLAFSVDFFCIILTHRIIM